MKVIGRGYYYTPEILKLRPSAFYPPKQSKND